MASFFNLTLDTTAPTSLSLDINEGAIYTNSQNVTLYIGLDDEEAADVTQMKIWGIDGAETEDDASWETYTPSKIVILTEGDGLKTVYLKVRDDVGNETFETSYDITLDTVVPAVSVTGPDKSKISEVEGYDIAIINFMSDTPFKEYKLCVVPATSSSEDAGTPIGSANPDHPTTDEKFDGEDLFPANTNIEVWISGSELATVDPGDGVKTIKVFVRTESGMWSVA